MTRNPAIELFVDILNRVALLYMSDRRAISTSVAAESNHAHARIADAVMSGNVGLARHRMRTHLQAEVEFLRRRKATRQALPSRLAVTAPAGQKRAEAVAREIFHGVVAGNLQPGDLIGSEPELMERYGVSRAVFREAVRLVEHDQVATMRRGPRGGLFVAPPSAAAVTDVVAVYLAWRGIDISALAELRIGVELALVDLVVDRMDTPRSARLDEAVAREAGAAGEQDSHGLHVTIAGLSGNRALELVALVLIRLTRLHQVQQLSERARDEILSEVRRTHEGIAAALQAGDREVARHRLRRHLDVLSTHLR
jgi:DNA-binding FadR family transcriptional regulator